MTNPSQEAVRIVENFWETGHGQAVATRMGEHYKQALSRMFIDMLTTYAHTIREEECGNRNAVVKEYKDEGAMFILKVEDGKTYEASMPIPKWAEVGKLEYRTPTTNHTEHHEK